MGEPNDYGSGEDCVHLRPGETEAGTWNDLVCSGTNSGFICQLDKGERLKVMFKDTGHCC